MTHNKNLIPLLYLLINCVSAKSAPQMFSVKEEYNQRFLNFLIIGLCNSSGNCWFDFTFNSTTQSTSRLFFKKIMNH